MMFHTEHRGASVDAMRTTVTLAPDVAAAVEQLRREKGWGPSEAVNELARRGLAAPAERRPYRNIAYPMGLTLDIDNIGELLERLDDLDGLDARERR